MATYSRADWGSAFARGGYAIVSPVSEVYVHHWNSDIQPERTVESAMARMRNGQRFHALTQDWGDIGYSWTVDDIGNIYEGRGWWRTGAHTYGYNSKGYGICWLGDSRYNLPSRAALEAIARVVQEGIAIGAIYPGPAIVAHRDRVPDTTCCGDPMYGQLDTIRALAAGGALPPSGDDDLTPEQDAILRAIAGPYKVDVYALSDGRWSSVGAGAPAPPGAVQLAMPGVPAIVAWVVEAATATRNITAQVANLSAQVAQLRAAGGGVGGGPSAADVANTTLATLKAKL
jgi:hypothetical protein